MTELRTLSYDPERQIIKVDERPHEADARIDRQQRQILFFVIVAGLALAAGAASWIAFIVAPTAANIAEREWARSILSAILTGVVGYAFGKK